MQSFKPHSVTWLWLSAACLLLVLTGCRRDLWVYTDEMHHLLLKTDWSEATEQPGGMTWWFISEDGSGYSRHDKTGDVTSAWLSLPRGRYEGIVFDYSPEEYSHQEFVGMGNPNTALVRLLPSAYQPTSGDALFGAPAVPDHLKSVPIQEETGLYTVSAEPDIMNADTLRHKDIVTGLSEDHVLWTERDKLEAKLDTQVLYAKPVPIVWKLKVRVSVKGIQYMRNVRGTIVGLTDGCWLVPLRHTSSPCLQMLETWSMAMVNDSVGQIATTINTFGLPDPGMPVSSAVTRADNATHYEYTKDLRLNLQFLLRDNKTYKDYHFDISDAAIIIDDMELIIQIDIPIDYPGAPDLPEVDPEGSTGFDADVSPWEEGGHADTNM